MQTLTPHQLQHIDQFLLEHYRLYYMDIRAEVVDHIAADIEKELHNAKRYDEAFVLVIAKWDELLKPASFFFRGIPKFIAQQWNKERLRRGAKACFFGALTTLGIGSFFYRFIDLDADIVWGLGTLLALYISIGIFYIFNRSLMKDIPLYTATGAFLRVEFKRLGWVQSIFVMLPLLTQMKFIASGDWFFYFYIFIGLVMLFYMIHWRIDYKKEKIYQIKWQLL
ncbi:hypothetical protein H4K35_12675 [Myroides sp. NP-2]|uniref:hypothetical protein n=1 Tax=Myroides sp. NP-2 TaxID=2759945 RepID=UPI0015F949D9|nr:hypothetical protein [Myroides sp. NP-2]MBB1150954.1 hypothetical protein [Myroides sp. NP-2]